MLSLPSIDTTSNIVGRLAAFSSTHSRSTWVHLNNWSLSHESPSVGSISPSAAPSFHNAHAWNKNTSGSLNSLNGLSLTPTTRTSGEDIHSQLNWWRDHYCRSYCFSFHSGSQASTLQNYRRRHQILWKNILRGHITTTTNGGWQTRQYNYFLKCMPKQQKADYQNYSLTVSQQSS